MTRLYHLTSRVALARLKLRETYCRWARRAISGAYRLSLVHVANLSALSVPVPQLQIKSSGGAGRGMTAGKKWEMILNTLPSDVSRAMDIGSNSGFYALNLASKGIFTIAIDPNKDLLRLTQLAALEQDVDLVATCHMNVCAGNVQKLPAVDVSLVLSVMHYWVQSFGWDEAQSILRTIWAKTSRCLYFEMPNPCENTKMAPYLQAMGRTISECQLFTESMLKSLTGSEVTFLDYLPTDFRGDERRHLFLVRRNGH